MRSVKAVMFDLDGCLADTTRGIIDSVRAALSAQGLYVPEDDAISPNIGKGARHLITQCLQDTSRLDETLKRFRTHYAEHCADRTKLYPGVKSVLRAMRYRGIALGVLTNKFSAATLRILEQTGIAPLFALILGEEDVAQRKPHPEGVQKFLQLTGIPPAQAAFVGDMEGDILTGRNAGTSCIAVTYGLGARDTLADADICLERFDALLTWLFDDGENGCYAAARAAVQARDTGKLSLDEARVLFERLRDAGVDIGNEDALCAATGLVFDQDILQLVRDYNSGFQD